MSINEQTNNIYFFGAGFSRGLHAAMPLLDELTEEIIKTEIGSKWRSHGNIEDILTYLNQSFPWEQTSLSLRKRADFLDLSKLIGTIITERQSRHFDLPESHRSLMNRISSQASPVITLNYDTLVEHILTQSTPPQSIDDIYPVALTNANARSGAGLWGKYPGVACQVYKLHGSVNWFYSGSENYFGEEIFYYPPSSTKVENAKNISDKVSLIVPPTYDKSVFMNNETVRDLWRLAGERIGFSKRLIFIGYSFPKSDLMIRYFLRETCSNIDEIVIIDKNAEVVERAKDIFPGKHLSSFISNDNPVADYLASIANTEPLT